jgi:hypothetical protein
LLHEFGAGDERISGNSMDRLLPALELFPAKWNRFAGKETLKIQCFV